MWLSLTVKYGAASVGQLLVHSVYALLITPLLTPRAAMKKVHGSAV